MTTQKLTAILRKAGFAASKYEASSMVRGWGTSTEGYKVSKWGSGFRVQHTNSTHYRGPDNTAKMLPRYLEALKAAGVAARLEQDEWNSTIVVDA